MQPLSPLSAISHLFPPPSLSGATGKRAGTELFMAALAGISPAESLARLFPAAGAANLGRNLALNDPESAYRMMTVINAKQVLYKSQQHELTRMHDAVATMEDAARGLDLTPDESDETAVAEVEGFVARYNDWIRQFDGAMSQGGLLADTQAAQMARRALDQSLDNIFHGAASGLRGLASIGITTDPVTGLADVDRARLKSALSRDRNGVAETMDQFAAHFAEAAGLLNSAGNFMPRQLDNLGRAIDYIEDNIGDWRKEFGSGDAPGSVVRALGAYVQTSLL